MYWLLWLLILKTLHYYRSYDLDVLPENSSFVPYNGGLFLTNLELLNDLPDWTFVGPNATKGRTDGGTDYRGPYY